VSRENAFRLSDPSLVCVSGEPQPTAALACGILNRGREVWVSALGAIGSSVRVTVVSCNPSVQQNRICYSR
jgi:hypothetical protein